MLEASRVWDRRETSDPVMTQRAYNTAIGLVLLWGFIVNLVTVMTIDPSTIEAVPGFLLFGGYIVCVIVGTMMYNGSDKPLVSFIGYNLVVIPVGIILTPMVAEFDPTLIKRALIHTTGFTGLMMMLGSSYPKFFESIGRTLGFSLIIVIVVELIMGFVFGIHYGIMDWIVALLFCGYIGYDWARANKIPNTLDNAIDSAAALYLDIINLFIRLLRIMSRR